MKKLLYSALGFVLLLGVGSLFLHAKATSEVGNGKTITASTVLSGYPATNANDGNSGTYWEGGAYTYPAYLTIDLGQNYVVDQVVFKAPWTRTENIGVEGGTSSTSYSTLLASASY